MAGRDAESSGLFWSAISVGAALVAALVLGFLVSAVTGGPAAGLTVAGVAFVVLGYVLSYYVLTPERGKPAEVHAVPAAPATAAQAPTAAPAAPLPEPAPTPPPGTGISERVREAARAAGEAARAAAGDAAPVPLTSAAPARPAGLPAPREGGPDDLKKIKGIGPKLEELLHGLGYYHFEQIAAWTPSEVAWVDSNLEGFNGRATRDDWVGQAKLLAAGGATEFSQRVDRGDVY